MVFTLWLPCTVILLSFALHRTGGHPVWCSCCSRQQREGLRVVRRLHCHVKFWVLFQHVFEAWRVSHFWAAILHYMIYFAWSDHALHASSKDKKTVHSHTLENLLYSWLDAWRAWWFQASLRIAYDRNDQPYCSGFAVLLARCMESMWTPGCRQCLQEHQEFRPLASGSCWLVSAHYIECVMCSAFCPWRFFVAVSHRIESASLIEFWLLVKGMESAPVVRFLIIVHECRLISSFSYHSFQELRVLPHSITIFFLKNWKCSLDLALSLFLNNEKHFPSPEWNLFSKMESAVLVRFLFLSFYVCSWLMTIGLPRLESKEQQSSMSHRSGIRDWYR